MLREINQILTGKEKRKGGVIALLDLAIAVLDTGFLALLMLLVNRYSSAMPAEARAGIAGRLMTMPVPLFLLLYLLKNIAGFSVSAFNHRFFAAVSTRLSREQLIRYFNGTSDNFNQTDASVFVRRISQQPVEFSTYILANAQTVVSQTLLAVCTLIAILLYHPVLVVILFVLMTPALVLMAWIFRSRLQVVRRGTKRAAERALQFLHESLGGYVEARVYRKPEFFTRRYQAEAQTLNNHIARQQTLQALPARLLEVVAVCGFFLLAAVLNRQDSTTRIEWITLAVFLGAMYRIMPAMVKLLNSAGQMKTYAFILPDLIPAVPASETYAPDFHTHPDRIRAVTVEGVRFCHLPGKPELKAAFRINEGSFVALTGQSGSGKTTLLQLMAGFLKPDEGRIQISYTGSGSRPPEPGAPGIVYVKQQPFLLHDSLRNNICLDGEPGDPEKLKRILRCCGLETVVSGHRDGVEQLITENGRNISGGQRQRIMLARALYHNPALLLLDEPFSQLDQAAETEMMQLLAAFAQSGMLVLIATHSLSASAVCDRIVSLDEPVYA